MVRLLYVTYLDGLLISLSLANLDSSSLPYAMPYDLLSSMSQLPSWISFITSAPSMSRFVGVDVISAAITATVDDIPVTWKDQ